MEQTLGAGRCHRSSTTSRRHVSECGASRISKALPVPDKASGRSLIRTASGSWKVLYWTGFEWVSSMRLAADCAVNPFRCICATTSAS